MKACLSWLVWAALATTLTAQQPTFRSGTRTVPLFVTVTDAQKRLVPDLERDDFQVFDNEKQQPISLFENEVRPLSIVVMLDTSGSMTSNIALLRSAAEQFLLRLLPQDEAKVGAFNDKIEVSGKFTSDRDDLIAQVKDLDYGNGTRLYDALSTSLEELEGVDRRRVVLVFTDGEDTSSRIGLGAVIERARVQEVMVYAIGLESVMFDGVRNVKSKPDSGLKKLAEETGGGYFELTKSSDLGQTFTRVAQELHSQYALGFEAPQLDGKVHKVAVKLRQPGMNARARRSYVAALDKTSTR